MKQIATALVKAQKAFGPALKSSAQTRISSRAMQTLLLAWKL
jgi:hypothetical protein